MMTLRQFAEQAPTIPAATSWYLADVAQSLGKQELFTKQAPQKLKALREHALIESAVSSNRIEGVEVDQEARRHRRVRQGCAARPRRRGSSGLPQGARPDPRERGRAARHRGDDPPAAFAVPRAAWATPANTSRTKTTSSRCIRTAGARFASARSRAADTPRFMAELIQRRQEVQTQRAVHPLIALGALNLDFLCIHPFRDGNGRTSRLLFLLECYHAGLEVGRYISLERLIEQNKERYYETLKLSSEGWHQGKHNPWHYINFLLYTLIDAYKEFERRVGQTASPRGRQDGFDPERHRPSQRGLPGSRSATGLSRGRR